MIRLASIPSRFRYFFKKPENERDAIIRKNVIGSLIFQFLTNLLGLLIVPLSLSYIDKEKYGIWINASVMVTWLQNMNFGMGFGMQNKVAQAMANDKFELAKEYVSIAYRFSTLIAIVLFVLGIFVSQFINWNHLFNSTLSPFELRTITFIAFVCFLTFFVFGNIVPLFNALKRTQVPKLFGLFTNATIIILLFTISRFSHNNIIWAAIALALPTPLIYLIGNIIFFKKEFRKIKPAWKIKDKTHVREVFSLGSKFFLMQLTTLVITQSDVFIITQYLGPSEVTPYSIITRYFYFGYFIFSLAIIPYWSGFTEAYAKKDFDWIKKALKQLFVGGLIASLLILVMLIFSFWLIPIWARHTFDIHHYSWLVVTAAVYVITLFYSSVVATFLNGISQLNYQLAVQIVMAILSVTLSILLMTKLKIGSVAINFGLIAAQLIYIGLCGRQTYLFIKQNEKRHLSN